MRLPKELLIGEEIYKVVFVKAFKGDKLQIGQYDPDGFIRIKTGLSKYERLETLVHEIMHALEAEYGVPMPHKLIKKLEGPVTEFIMNNFMNQDSQELSTRKRRLHIRKEAGLQHNPESLEKRAFLVPFLDT